MQYERLGCAAAVSTTVESAARSSVAASMRLDPSDTHPSRRQITTIQHPIPSFRVGTKRLMRVGADGTG